MPKEKQTLTWSDMETIGSVSDLVNAHPTKEPTSFEIRSTDAVVDQEHDPPPTAGEMVAEMNANVAADGIRAKEAGDLLAWLHAQGHLKFSSLSAQVLLDIQAGKHRR